MFSAEDEKMKSKQKITIILATMLLLLITALPVSAATVCRIGSIGYSAGRFTNITCDKSFGTVHKLYIKGGNFRYLDIRNGGNAVISGGKFPDVFSVNVHDSGSKLKVTGGNFFGIQCYEGGSLTLSGGKNTGPVLAGGPGAKVTINKHTVNIKREIVNLPNAILIAEGGTFKSLFILTLVI